MRCLRSGFPLFTLVVVFACSPAPRDERDTTADRSAIDSAHQAFLGGMRASDCDALLRLATDDVVFAPPNMPSATGPDGVRAWCQPIFTQVRTTGVTVSGRDVVVAGDWAIEHGDFDWTVAPVAGGAAQRDQGKFVAIWRRQADGSWKVARDIWNSSLPAPTGSGR